MVRRACTHTHTHHHADESDSAGSDDSDDDGKPAPAAQPVRTGLQAQEDDQTVWSLVVSRRLNGWVICSQHSMVHRRVARRTKQQTTRVPNIPMMKQMHNSDIFAFSREIITLFLPAIIYRTNLKPHFCNCPQQ
jgi:hypothetical protein